jgi:hypothetical protein
MEIVTVDLNSGHGRNKRWVSVRCTLESMHWDVWNIFSLAEYR